jgi:hypothetical protein
MGEEVVRQMHVDNNYDINQFDEKMKEIQNCEIFDEPNASNAEAL